MPSMGPVDTTQSVHAKLRTLPFAGISLTGGFWARKQEVNRQASLKHGYKTLKEIGTHDHFLFAAGKGKGDWKGHRSRDSDLYKWIEAAAYELAVNDNDEIRRMVDESIEVIIGAQMEDGYLNTYFQYAKPAERWADIAWGHELYTAGHLIQAAVAMKRVLGDERLLDVACRFADLIDSMFGPGRREEVPGHPGIEMAIIELFRLTDEKRYLDLARCFIDRRGHKTLKTTWYGSWYYPDHVPVREAKKIEGHAVRALYLTSAVADLYIEVGDAVFIEALKKQWHNMTLRKMYITGGLGSRHDGEAFGADYELPNGHAYCETCASIAGIMWGWRMLLATGDGRFADVIERMLYNGFLGGVSADGTTFFYTNPLLSSNGKERQQWYSTACCPPNIMRMMGSLQHYIATTSEEGIQIHQYMPARIKANMGDGKVELMIETRYPWEGTVKLTIAKTDRFAGSILLRVPGWCNKPSLRVNGIHEECEVTNGYTAINRTWHEGDTVELELPMEPRLTAAHPMVETNQGRVAIERGPIVYCFEQTDHGIDLDILNMEIDTSVSLKTEWRKDVLGGIMIVEASGNSVSSGTWGEELYGLAPRQGSTNTTSVNLTAIPYYARANRGKCAMRIWVPTV